MPTYADRLPAKQPQVRRDAPQDAVRTLKGDEPGLASRNALQQLANARYERKQAERAALKVPAPKVEAPAPQPEPPAAEVKAEAPEAESLVALAGPKAKAGAGAEAPPPPAEGPPATADTPAAGEAESAGVSAQGSAGGSAGTATPPPATTDAPAVEAAPEDQPKAEEEKKEDKKEDQKEGKDKKPELPDSPKDPKEDPAFQAVLATNAANAEQQAVHTDPATEVVELQGAAVLPEEEQAAEADMEGHMGAMEEVAEQQERKPFTPATFKEKLKANLDELEKQLPNDADSAEEFKEEEPIGAVKEDIAGQVAAEKDAIAGPLEATSGEAEPPATGAPTTAEVPLEPEDPGPMVPDLDPAAAVPKPFADHEISMEEESASLDEKMAENNVTEEQLEKSNEPEFLEGLSKKREAQQKAAEAPGVYRGQEAGILDQARGGALEQGQTAAMGMLTARVEGFGAVMGGQLAGETTSETEQDRIKAEFQKIYDRTKEEVNTQLEAITTQVTELFDTEAEAAKTTFEDNVEEKLDDIYGVTVIDDWLFGEDTEAIEKVFVEEKATFVSTMDGVLDRIATIIADGLNGALATIAKGREESQVFYDGLDESQKKLAEDSFTAFNDQYTALEDTVYEKEDELARDLAQSYKDNVDGLRESFDKIKEEVAAGWIGGALNALVGIIETIIKIGEMLTNLLSAVIEAVGAILSDPIGFLSNLIDGVKLGFEQFFTNIKTHIISGLIEWLTGSLGGVGITMPDDIFSLGGVFDLTMQILGLGWDFLREKAVKLLGEPVVQAMEVGAELFIKLKNGGIDALWEELKEQFQDIQQVVMDAIRDMVITKVVEAGIKWIMGLLSPAGAFIKAAMMVIDIVTFFVERAASIIDLVMAFIDGIRALAKGDISSVANAIEKALAKAIPILIGFLAALVGVTGLAGKVQNIVKKIRKRVDKAVTKVIKKIGKKFKGKGGKDKKGGKDDGKDEGKPDKDGLTPADKKKHAKIGKAIQKKMTKVAAKGKGKGLTFEELHAAKKKEAAALEQHYQKELNPNIKLSITIGDLASDKKDGDVDVKVRIAPNTYEVKFNIEGEEEHAEFKELIHLAMEIAGGEARGKNLNAGTFPTGGKTLSETHTDISTEEGKSKRDEEMKAEGEALNTNKEKEKAELQESSNRIHNEIRKSMVDFKHAASAQYFPNNTFQVGGGNFFVETRSNNYIFPTSKAKKQYFYGLGKELVSEILDEGAENLEKAYRETLDLDKDQRELEGKKRQLTSLSNSMSTKGAPSWTELLNDHTLPESHFKLPEIEKVKARFAQAKLLAEAIRKEESFVTVKPLPKDYQRTIDRIREMSGLAETSENSLKQLDFIKQYDAAKIFDRYKSEKPTITVPQSLFGAYPYGALGAKPMKPSKAKKLYQGFPGSIKNDSTDSTLFVASVVVEPTRSDAAYISNMLLLNEDSKLNNRTQAPALVESQKIKDGKVTDQKLKKRKGSTGVFDHMPMTLGGSDPLNKKHKALVEKEQMYDPAIKDKKGKGVYVNVSNRNLASVQLNPKLQRQLEKSFKKGKADKTPKDGILASMVQIIKSHLNLE